MRKEAEILSHQLAPNTVLSLLDETSAPLATHITIPTGASISSSITDNSTSNEFTKSLKTLELTISPSSSAYSSQQKTTELNFGTPQIDLSLPQGTLSKDGIHEFNPKHFRDQDLAFKTALTVAAREISSEETKPIFCFLTEDQTNLIQWLSSREISNLGLSKENLIVITAKHTDDLLWAMEETLHTVDAVALVAHFTLLSNISAQRLSFASKSKKTPCLLICNHKIEGPNHTKSKWTVWSETEEENLQSDKIGLSLSQIKNEKQNASWVIKWQAEKGRFTTSLKETLAPESRKIH
jgi:hypothetical protein